LTATSRGSTRVAADERSSSPIPSLAACSCFAAGAARRSASWSMTVKDSGWLRSGFRRGSSCGGRAETSPESAIFRDVFAANLQNVRSALAGQLVRRELVVAWSILRRKTDRISSPRAASCKLAGSSRFSAMPQAHRAAYFYLGFSSASDRRYAAVSAVAGIEYTTWPPWHN
jgi:hypothetical protein